MDGLFCVECGREGPTVDALCADCIRERVQAATAPPAGAAVDICRHCGATPSSGSWHPAPAEHVLVERVAIAAVQVVERLEDVEVTPRVEKVDRDRYRVLVHVAGSFGGVPLSADLDIPVKVRGAACPACSRRHGGYFEAVVQVRGPGEDLDETTIKRLDEIVMRTVGQDGGRPGSQAYLLRSEAMHGGMDYYFGTMNTGRVVAKAIGAALGARATESKTIAGKKDGNDIFRLTIGLRLPRAVAGDLVGLEASVYRLLIVEPHRALAEEVGSGRREAFDERTMERFYRFKPAEIRRVDVVFAHGDEAQLLDPDTARVVAVRVPGLETGAQVYAVLWNDRWWVVNKA